MKKALSGRDKLKAQCVRWYRKNGNNCEFSVWRLIRLVIGHHGMGKLDAAEAETAAYYARRISSDIASAIGSAKQI